MYQALLIIFLLVGVCLVAFIIPQQGKGANISSTFGAGASSTLFGSSGSSNFMTRTTAILAMIFFILSLMLGNINSSNSQKGSKWDNLSQPQQEDLSKIDTEIKFNNDIPK